MPAPKAATRTWTIMGHVDATPFDIGPAVTRQVLDFHRNAPASDANVIMQVRSTRPWMAMAGVAAVVAAPLVGSMVGGMVGSAIGTVGFNLGIMASFMGGRRLLVPNWDGTRTFDMSAAGKQPVVLANESYKQAPSHQRLSQYLLDTMAAYPSQKTAVYVGGHGEAYHMVADMDPKTFAASLAEVHAASGKKVDLVIMDACLMGNLEVMRLLAPHAKYAVASEESVPAKGLPVNRVLGTLPNDPKDFGKALQDIDPDATDTLSVIDLEQVEPLCQAMENLAPVLEKAAANGQAGDIRDSIRWTQRFPAGGFLTPDLGLRDLGGFLANLQENCSGDVAQAAQQVQKQYQKAVVFNGTDVDLDGKATGLTMQMGTKRMDTQEYARTTGMNQWAHFLATMKPWKSSTYGA